jgi:osmotically-inducible protein OsmY
MPDDIKDRIVTGRISSARADTCKIHVVPSGGKVVPIGTVRCWSEREEAEWVGRSEPGVTEVDNRIRVQRESDTAGADPARPSTLNR